MLQTRQVFAVGPSSLVCFKKLAGDNRAGSRVRGFSVGVFLGRVVVSKVGWAWADNQSKGVEGGLTRQ